MASSNGLQTMAFPAFGTGVLQYPPDLVASQMFCSVERFKQQRPTSPLRKVMFVIYPKNKDIVQVSYV